MELKNHISLKDHNTFGIDVKADAFVRIQTANDLQNAVSEGIFTKKYLVLGGGSNILFTGDFHGTVIQNAITGIKIEDETADAVFVSAKGGETWHKLVMFCVERDLGGIENLSLIPGTVGAAPIQNIGAYGVELKETFFQLTAIDLSSGDKKIFTHADCKFGYRNSIFKQELKGKYFIYEVTVRLEKNKKLNVSYGAIRQVLNEKGIEFPTIKNVSDAVIQIRKSKLPDPEILGNAGSFFKNPEIPTAGFEILKKEFPEIPGYPLENNFTKIPAGWLIEQCGWKGKRIGNTGAHKDQALVLVNYGGATGNEIYTLALEIVKSVKEKFGIEIQPEVNII